MPNVTSCTCREIVGIVKFFWSPNGRSSIRTDERRFESKVRYGLGPVGTLGESNSSLRSTPWAVPGIWDGQVLEEPRTDIRSTKFQRDIKCQIMLRHQCTHQEVDLRFYIRRHVQFLSLICSFCKEFQISHLLLHSTSHDRSNNLPP